MTDIECPFCNKEIDPYDIMGDSDWDDQASDTYETECPHCEKYIKITQIDWYMERSFCTEEAKQ